MSARFSFPAIEILEARIAPATFIVSSAADDGPGTLRQAILDANATDATDLIRIDGIETIALFSPLPKITDSVVLQGNGATLDGTAITSLADGIVLESSGSKSGIYDLTVTHFTGHGFVLGHFNLGYIEGCAAVENGRETGGSGFWVRGNFTTLRDVQAIGNGGPGILFKAEGVDEILQECLVDGAYTRENAGPEVELIDLERSGIVNSTFVHGDEAAIALHGKGRREDRYSGYRITYDGNTYIGTSTVPIDLGNNGRSPHDAPLQPTGYFGRDGWPDAPVLTEFKALGDVSYVRGFIRSGYHMETEISLYSEEVVDGNTVRVEIDRFMIRSDENGLGSFIRILPAGMDAAGTSLRATRFDNVETFFFGTMSEMSDAATATVADPSTFQIANPKKVVFKDWDGNPVTITTTKGRFTPENFDLIPDQQGYHLGALRLDSRFEGAKIRLSVKSSPTGDGTIYVGEVHAEGVNLHTLSIEGNLQELTVGRTDGSLSLKKLSVGTLGAGYDIIFRNPFAGGTSIISQGTIREFVCQHTVENAAIVSLGGNIGKFDAGFSLTDSLVLAHNIGTIKVYSFMGGTAIRAESGGIGKIHVGAMGSGQYGHDGDISARTTIGSIVSGDMRDTRIVAHADPQAELGKSPTAIDSILVKGKLVNSQILAGVPLDPLTPESDIGAGNANARIGTVRVTKDWISSDLAAGIDAGADGHYGTADDKFYAAGITTGAPAIAQLVIGGKWKAEGEETHAVIARDFGVVKVAGAKLPIPPGTFGRIVATAERDSGEMRLVQL